MSKRLTIYLVLVLTAACKQSYEPPEIKAPNNFLVVDGFVNATAGAVTSFTLSRSRNLVDTVDLLPEANALVIVEANSGQKYQVPYQGNGVYSAGLPINSNAQYRLTIQTQNGSQYASAFVPVKTTPAIDSVTWQQAGDASIFVSTHDPQNAARYYRWDYEETWQYQSSLNTEWGLNGNMIYYRTPIEQTYICWKTAKSTQINTATSIKLSQDVIERMPVALIPQHSPKIQFRYSILVNQYALTPDAFNYWEILKKNTEELGTLFDPQPSQLPGNFKCLSNPAEPVLGFLSASTVQSQRIFIDKSQVTDWTVPPSGLDCQVKVIPQNANFALYTYPDTAFAPYFFVSGGLVIAKKFCLDCRIMGGTNIQPTFW